MIPAILFIFQQVRLELAPPPPTLEQRWCKEIDRSYCAPTVPVTPKNHSEL